MTAVDRPDNGQDEQNRAEVDLIVALAQSDPEATADAAERLLAALAARPSADTETLRVDPDRVSDLLRGERVGTEVIRSDEARRLANLICAALDAR